MPRSSWKSSPKPSGLRHCERASGKPRRSIASRSADISCRCYRDVLRSLPNANMADALGRLPRRNIEARRRRSKYVQIRGTGAPRQRHHRRRQYPFTRIRRASNQAGCDSAADIVESVEINKTLQANMDADGIGGSVNFVTKTAGERPTVNLSGMGGYTRL